VSSLKNNLIYVGCLVDIGHVMAFSNYKCWVFNNLQKKKVMAIGQKNENNGLYHIHTESPLMISVEVENANENCGTNFFATWTTRTWIMC